MIIKNSTNVRILANIGRSWEAEPQYSMDLNPEEEKSIRIPDDDDFRIVINEVP